MSGNQTTKQVEIGTGNRAFNMRLIRSRLLSKFSLEQAIKTQQ
jgi:hypothetical protein